MSGNVLLERAEFERGAHEKARVLTLRRDECADGSTVFLVLLERKGGRAPMVRQPLLAEEPARRYFRQKKGEMERAGWKITGKLKVEIGGIESETKEG